MTLAEFGAMIADIDPKAKRYFSTERGPFTVWHEYEQISAYAQRKQSGRMEGAGGAVTPGRRRTRWRKHCGTPLSKATA